MSRRVRRAQWAARFRLREELLHDVVHTQDPEASTQCRPLAPPAQMTSGAHLPPESHLVTGRAASFLIGRLREPQSYIWFQFLLNIFCNSVSLSHLSLATGLTRLHGVNTSQDKRRALDGYYRSHGDRWITLNQISMSEHLVKSVCIHE